jgi:hypothetical protein
MATASASGTEAYPSATADATAIAGDGGFAGSGQCGSGGTATASANAYSDYGGLVSVSATVASGGCQDDDGSDGGGSFLYSGANYPACLITNPAESKYAVSGYSTDGYVTLNENATGGSSDASNVLPTEGDLGAGSNGTAILIASSTHSEIYFGANTTGTGGGGTSGGGGDLWTGNGYSGGNGIATTSLTGSGETEIYANSLAYGGNGGWGIGGVPGNGGSGTATSIGQSSGSGYVLAYSTVYGGNGGTNGDNGEPDEVGGLGGSGGQATSSATVTSDSGNAEAEAWATGGIGGSGYGSGTGATSGNGGAATATANATGTYATASAVATAGYSAPPGDGAAYGSGGVATASSTANGVTVVQIVGPGADGGGGFAQDAVNAGPGGATVSFGSNQNNGSATVTGSSAVILAITGTGSLTVGDGTHATALLLSTTGGSSNAQSSFAINAESTLHLVTDSTSTMTFGGGNTNNGALNVTGTGSTSIGDVNGSGSLIIGDGTNSTTLQIASNSASSSFGSLTINNGSALDITNNKLFIDYGSGPDPIASIAAWIRNGFYDLTGPQIISSEVAADDTASGLSYGIGYADGADGIVAGLPSGEIEIMYTLLGDANLDGTVNAEDYTLFSTHLFESGAYWDDGDFNYDGTVNFEDYTPYSHNEGNSALLASDAGTLELANGAFVSVPEPNSVSFAAIGLVGLLRRRKRRYS